MKETIENRELKSFLITGATDGIGLTTALKIAKSAEKGTVLGVHGRKPAKLDHLKRGLLVVAPDLDIRTYCYDLSSVK